MKQINVGDIVTKKRFTGYFQVESINGIPEEILLCRKIMTSTGKVRKSSSVIEINPAYVDKVINRSTISALCRHEMQEVVKKYGLLCYELGYSDDEVGKFVENVV